MQTRDLVIETVLRTCEYASLLSVFTLYIFLRPKISYKTQKSLPPSIPRGTLIVANHQSKLDPFFIVYHLGFRNLLLNAPLYFPAASEYMRNVFLGLPMRLMGCFDIGTTPLEKAKGLLRIRTLLGKKKTVLIFPEGRIVGTTTDPLMFEKGISFLLEESTPVIFARISGLDTWSFFSLKKHQTEIHFSDIMSGDAPREEKIEAVKHFFGMETKLQY